VKQLSWDDWQVFLHVAETGGLSGAARRTGLSPPTIGRRMLALEQRIGQTLFVRAQTGYRLTPAGAALRDRLRPMSAAASAVATFLSDTGEAPLIRLSAGTGTTAFLADRFAQLCRPGDAFRLHFVTTEATLDLAHRAADLGIRNRPPEAGNLAVRRLGTLCFAPYRSWAAARPELLDWVALDRSDARHPAAHWVHRQGHPIHALAASVATLHNLIRAGAGIGVMPCMIGDSDPVLTRAGPVIAELTEAQYLVVHNEDRHRPPLRRVIARLVAIYRTNADLLAGARALRG
jgi:DNA-binding transcriptional LysR family regulator